jgi:hypothetical protein
VPSARAEARQCIAARTDQTRSEQHQAVQLRGGAYGHFGASFECGVVRAVRVCERRGCHHG